jgi:hypothetical protein
MNCPECGIDPNNPRRHVFNRGCCTHMYGRYRVHYMSSGHMQISHAKGGKNGAKWIMSISGLYKLTEEHIEKILLLK